MLIHPLLNKESMHYVDEKGRQTIQDIEDDLTVTEMIGACKFNIRKYNKRLGKKDNTEKELYKIETYTNYLAVLLKLDDAGYCFDTVTVAYDKANIHFRYTF